MTTTTNPVIVSVVSVSNGGAPWTIEVSRGPHPLGVSRGDAIWSESELRRTLAEVMRALPGATLSVEDAAWLEQWAVTDDAGRPWGLGDTPVKAWRDALEWMDGASTAAQHIESRLAAGLLPEQETIRMRCGRVTPEETARWRSNGYYVEAD